MGFGQQKVMLILGAAILLCTHPMKAATVSVGTCLPAYPLSFFRDPNNQATRGSTAAPDVSVWPQARACVRHTAGVISFGSERLGPQSPS